MEKPGSPRSLKTNLLCIPSLKTGGKNHCGKSGRASSSPTAVLERFREAVFRLIMLSALSSGNAKAAGHGGSDDVAKRSYHFHPDNDHRHSEAVADCIEFIKKKAGPD